MTETIHLPEAEGGPNPVPKSREEYSQRLSDLLSKIKDTEAAAAKHKQEIAAEMQVLKEYESRFIAEQGDNIIPRR